MTDTCEIDSITFGVYSPEEILNMAVCQLDSVKKSGPGTVYDPRMGTTDSSQLCVTCNKSAIHCIGHFGCIVFNECIVHPLYYARVLSFLRCFCMKCNRLCITEEQIQLKNIHRSKGEQRMALILEYLKKVDLCCQPGCGAHRPYFRFTKADSTYSRVYQDKSKNRTSINISTDEIKKIFERIPDNDIRLLGFDPANTHPRNFIISVLPVPPPCVRPYTKTENNLSDDDLTIQYIEIIKTNNELQTTANKQPKDMAKSLATLRFRVHTTFDNSQGKAKHTTNGRAIKGMKERLKGKEGQIRKHMMGKRCNYTGRTVIGPEPTLKMGQLAVPVEMANILTVPVRVASYNLKLMQDLVDTGNVDSLINPDGKLINLKRYRRGTQLQHGDIIIRHESDNKEVVQTGRELVHRGDKVYRGSKEVTKLNPCNRHFKISEGWIVERKLTDGDYVILNRQPTLHMASMMAMQVVVMPYKTMRMNLAITKPFNADFDGKHSHCH